MTQTEMFPKPKREPTAARATPALDQWLVDVGLEDSHDPDVAILRDASAELDWLETADLTDKELVAARKGVRYTIGQARSRLQKQLDRADSVRTMRRHQVMYGGLVGETLGWIDVALLSDDLRTDVTNYLEDRHGITVADMRGVVQEL